MNFKNLFRYTKALRTIIITTRTTITIRHNKSGEQMFHERTCQSLAKEGKEKKKQENRKT